MELKLSLSSDDVSKIIEAHVRKVLAPFTDGKHIEISGDSYYSMSAKVVITEKGKDDE